MTAKTMAQILVVEDEPHLARMLCDNLQDEGYRTLHTPDGLKAVEMACQDTPDLVVLDVMLPGQDGYSVCKQLRARNLQMPVLFLTARHEVAQRVRGLRAGGDDYLGKPFDLTELLLRIQALLRRTAAPCQPVPPQAQSGATHAAQSYRLGRWQFKPAALLAISSAGETVCLDAAEAQVIAALLEASQQVVAKDALVQRAFADGIYPSTRAVDMIVQRWQRRLADQPDIRLETVPGVGYRLLQVAPD